MWPSSGRIEIELKYRKAFVKKTREGHKHGHTDVVILGFWPTKQLFWT